MSSWSVIAPIKMKTTAGAQLLNWDFGDVGSGLSCVLAFLYYSFFI